jgi:single-strand DNA-binding protein
MAGETVLTIVGNLTADPELRFTSSGAAVTNVTVASTPRVYNKQTGEWTDGEPVFMRCNIWRDQAEHVAESLTKGLRVLVQGRLQQRSYTSNEGEKRTVIELNVEDIAPSLKYATAKVTKAARTVPQQQVRTAAGGDPWAAAASPEGDLVGAAAGGDKPPF